ncbi:phosphoserine phosphatase SerB [Sphingomicrobium astaxanthinifaciens]|uniref:phosphoserine phosphatase SerB n=1 Tax=Sphingomicrobium astaxanthinifaciens TaxID=1227949 RepID=UPI001FCB346D|nr:phosphoserine phosphatase SerB [Sphingomicrobium astaxanthinifaciens]MCJ7420283.1 phosphoserine phosphatase SerB [Sphingomicrobium astaxanthinifaciens]
MAIATLIAAAALDASRLETLAARLGAEARWLEVGRVARLESARPVAELRAALAEFEGVDHVVHDHDRPPALFLADMDSTMIGQECIDELAALAGVGAAVADITERAMRGELDFARALAARLALLEGLEVAAIETLLATRIRPNRGAATLVGTLSRHGVRTVLVSGGFTAFAEPVARALGFDRVVANRLEVANGRLTGRVEGAVVDGAVKRAVLVEERARCGGPVVAIGDGANDLPMLHEADLGIAYRAKPRVAAAADARLDHADLDALLHAFGFTPADPGAD